MSKAARVFSREVKLSALRRMLAGENVSVIARELKLRRTLLYVWRDNFRSDGPDALRNWGRPRKSALVAPSRAPAEVRPHRIERQGADRAARCASSIATAPNRPRRKWPQRRKRTCNSGDAPRPALVGMTAQGLA